MDFRKYAANGLVTIISCEEYLWSNQNKKREFFRIMISMKLMYLANIIVAGSISITSLFQPKTAVKSVFTGAFAYSEAIQLVGALWFAIFLLSIVGLFYPKQMCLVLVFQLIYKSSWLLFVALPAVMNSKPYPKSMAIFFVVWVVLLPFVIPWKEILN